MVAEWSELERARCVVKSPGVPAEAPAIAAAHELGIPVIGELELSWRLLPNRFCAVTGTNGKTTVAELLGHVWRTAGQPVAVAGNVGTPLASLVGELDPEATVICEASSFQLEDADSFAPECGVLLNLAPDHLDRHRTFEAYRAAKLRMFANQVQGDVCVYNGADPALAGVELGGRGRKLDFSERLGEFEFSLPGPHNAENAAAAAVAAEALGIGERGDRGCAVQLPRRAPPARAGGGDRRRALRQRLEGHQRRRRDRRAALVRRRRARDPRWLAQGRRLRGARARGRRALRGLLPDRRGGRAARARPRRRPGTPGVEHRRCDGLADGGRGRRAPTPRPARSCCWRPACASFDSYRDFEERGEHFRALVEELDR